MSKLKKKIHLLLDPTDGGTGWDKAINTFIIALIILNTLAVILETVDSIFLQYKTLFGIFEFFSVTVFSIEYLLRLWTCTCIEKYHHPITGRLKYIFSFGGLIDFIAVIPFYIPATIVYDLRFIRILRLIRFFKISRYLNASRTISKVLQDKKEELIISLGITMFLIIIASCFMFYAEHDTQPDKFSSIPETMWWSVATLTTVGYGDIFPVTSLGKTLTAIISILGVGMFALPAGILASGFSDVLKHTKKEKKHCPHCGNELDKG